jgi:hypothetical protein
VNLADYRTNVRDILKDANANFYSVAQVDRWINRGRKQVARKGRCVRRLPPPAGSVSSVMVTGSGAAYTTATVEISAPDANTLNTVQATATANVSGGQITSITVTEAGSGYVAEPTVTITGDGTGAEASAVLSGHITTVAQQELYQMATFAAAISSEAGLGNLLGILKRTDFSTFQAFLRSNSMNIQNYPQVWAQYGQGVTGSIYLWPIPSMVTAMEVDCYFDVLDLSGAQTADLIPEPWEEPVYYYAAYLAYLNAQRHDDARTMLGEHERLMTLARAIVQTDMIPDPYGEG